MGETRYVNLPIIGRVQHGEKIKNKVTEYGYFIAKIQDDFMKAYLEKFNELFKGKQSVDIEFFDENPLSMKYARYNQSGEACSCNIDSSNAKLKTKNGWQDIKCDLFNCQYRQKNENGKMACNRIGWLKFLIPSICKDRIWLMRITGQTSLDRLDDYFTLQKIQGNNIKGHYTLFLKQEEQSNSQGQTFNNYILDILKKEDFISNNQIQLTNPKQEELSTKSTQNVNNNVAKLEEKRTTEQIAATNTQIQNDTSKEKTTKKTSETKETSKKTTNRKTVKTKETPVETKPEEESQNNKFDNCYGLIKTFNETLVNKQGESKEYLVGEFVNMEDEVFNIIIRPENADELLECDLGTFVKLDVKDVGGRKFAMDLKFIEKRLKNIAA